MSFYPKRNTQRRTEVTDTESRPTFSISNEDRYHTVDLTIQCCILINSKNRDTSPRSSCQSFSIIWHAFNPANTFERKKNRKKSRKPVNTWFPNLKLTKMLKENSVDGKFRFARFIRFVISGRAHLLPNNPFFSLRLTFMVIFMICLLTRCSLNGTSGRRETNR